MAGHPVVAQKWLESEAGWGAETRRVFASSNRR